MKIVLLLSILIIQTVFSQSVVDQGQCADSASDCSWILDSEGTLTISGSGNMKNYGVFTSSPFLEMECQEIVIGDQLKSIGSSAFYGCTVSKEIKIPANIKTIGNEAFRDCTSLPSVDFSENTQITTLSSFIFYGCSVLTSVTFPNSITTIGSMAFSGCTSLESITIPNTVTEIGFSAFLGCTSLNTVQLSNILTTIEEQAFSGCTSLESITIPKSVTTIDKSAFSGCTSLASFGLEAGGQSFSVDESGILYNLQKTTLIRYPPDLAGTTYTFPDSVTAISAYAFDSSQFLETLTIPTAVTTINSNTFQSCTALKEIILPKEIESIGSEAFSKCSALTEITLPEAIESISSSMFYECTQLTKIIIPESVKTINNHAFYGCTSLKEVTIMGTIEFIGYDAFSSCSSLEKVYYYGTEDPETEGGGFPYSESLQFIVPVDYSDGTTNPTFCGKEAIRTAFKQCDELTLENEKDRFYCTCVEGANYENTDKTKCKCTQETPEYDSTGMKCYTPPTCDASKGEVANLDKCVCNENSNFENKAPDGATTLDCKCKDNKPDLVKEGTEEPYTYTCKKCSDDQQQYDATGKRCYEPATCTKPGQQQQLDDCVCTQEGFEDDTEETEEKQCKCSDSTKHIIKTVNVDQTVTYKCAACGEREPKYDANEMRCYKEATCSKPGEIPQLDQCVCSVQEGFETNGDTNKPCKCTETSKHIIKKVNGDKTTYNCEACPADKPEYKADQMACVASGVSSLFVLLAMALFFVF